MGFGANVKKLREERGITQVQVAKDLFMTPQMYCGIENEFNQPPLNAALQIARYFNTDVETLAGYK